MHRFRAGHAWIAGFAVAFAVLALVYRDSYQQDGGYHFLFARWAWTHPDMFVGVWSRPLFTFLYAFPALLGYTAAKLFTAAISCGAAWLTWRTAERLGMAQPAAAIPLLLLQPSVFLIASDTMTEPLFALVLAGALLSQASGRAVAGMILVSLLPCIRPEGFFVVPFWALHILAVERGKLRWLPILGLGMLVWWSAALVVTGDPLWILHNWPHNWRGAGYYTAGTSALGRAMTFVYRFPEIAGPLLMLLAPIGLWNCFRRHTWLAPGLFLLLFLVHSVLWAFGLFGSAGYPRYFVCVAPALALILLEGWQLLSGWLGRAAPAVAAGALLASAVACLAYVDAWVWTRDCRAIDDAVTELRKQSPPVDRVIWSQAYMCIALDRDPRERDPMWGDVREHIRTRPARTLIFWDADTGPSWYKLGPADFEGMGYRRLLSRDYLLAGRVFRWLPFGFGGVRKQVMHLYYRD